MYNINDIQNVEQWCQNFLGVFAVVKNLLSNSTENQNLLQLIMGS